MNHQTRLQSEEFEEIVGIPGCVKLLGMTTEDVDYMLEEQKLGVDIAAKYSDVILAGIALLELSPAIEDVVESALNTVETIGTAVESELERVSRKEVQ